MTKHDEAWYQRRDAQVREWLTLCDKQCTPEELAAARAALTEPRSEAQKELPLKGDAKA